jgi:hypothetical protein
MLDPSLFLAEHTLAYVREELERSGEKVYVPARFLEVARASISYREGAGAFFGEGGDEVAGMRFRDWAQSGFLVAYKPTEAEIEGAGQVVAELRELTELDGRELTDDVREILVQEWVYLRAHSWIGACIDKAAKAFEKCGAVAVDLGSDAFGLMKNAGEAVPGLLTSKPMKWVYATGLSAGALAAVQAAGPAIGLAGLIVLVGGVAAQDTVKDLSKKAFLKIDP